MLRLPPFLRFLTLLALLAAYLPVASAKPPVKSDKNTVTNTVISRPEANLRFELPAGFTPLSAAEVTSKYGGGKLPLYMAGNASRSVTIAYDWKDNQPLLPEKLPGAKKYFEDLFGRLMTKLVWKDRQIKRINGHEWLVLEFTSFGAGTDLHSFFLVTSQGGKMLSFNYNATQADFPALEKALRKSMASIVIKAKP